MQGAQHQVAGLSCFHHGREGLPVADLTDQDHIGIFPHRRPQSRAELGRVAPHLALADQGPLTGMHKLHRILDGDDVLVLGGVDPLNHRRQGCALATAGGTRHQHHPLLIGGEGFEHLGHLQGIEARDRLGNEPQHHAGAPQSVEQVDAQPRERKGMGAVVVLLAKELIQLHRSENLPHPTLELGQVGERPPRRAHFAPGPETGFLTHPQVHIGEAAGMGDPGDLLEAGGQLVGPGGRRADRGLRRQRRRGWWQGRCLRNARDHRIQHGDRRR